MSAANAYRAKTATFASSGKLGLTSLKVGSSGQTTDLVSDAVDSVCAVFVDALVIDVTMTVSAVDGVNTIKPGDAGSLVLVFQKRAEGRAAAGGGDLTATMANAVVVSNETEAGTTGIGSATLSFRCSASAGGGGVVWS